MPPFSCIRSADSHTEGTEVTEPEVQIRPYRASDRAAVRAICCATADRGAPSEGLFPDRELLADLVTRYYTDYEPDSSWVAEDEGTIIGYITGALDTRRAQQILAWRIVPGAVCRSLLRGILFRRQTWRIIAGLPRNLFLMMRRAPLPLAVYPAHLHIDILPNHRGQRVGMRLMEAFLGYAAARVSGVHATVRADNPRACSFFNHVGFAAVGSYEIVLLVEGRNRDVRTTVYGRRLTGA